MEKLDTDWILISCPVYERAWILPHWFDCIMRQTWPLEKIGFQFLCHENDIETVQCLFDIFSSFPMVRCFEVVIDNGEDHKAHPVDGRHWSKERYHAMVRFRNTLLDRACAMRPSRYFSLDSDLLLENKDTISTLFELTRYLDAASPLSFMTPNNKEFPSVMTWHSNSSPGPAYRRPSYPLGTLFKSDIIMAAVMMSEKIYMNTRYTWHPQGEDLGWSADCAVKGFSLYCASYLYAVHIMSNKLYESYKSIGDFRTAEITKLSE